MKTHKNIKPLAILIKYKLMLIFVLVFTMIGTLVLFITQAATPTIAIETENSTVTAPAAVVADTQASSGSAVKFSKNSGNTPQTLNCVPTATNTMTNSVSHLCGFPDATNTGIPAGTVLKRVPQDITAPDSATGSGWHFDSRGWISVDTDGAVIQNIDTTYNIDITANNVTVQRVKVHTGNDMFGISVRHTTNTIIQDSEIHGGDVGANRLLVAIKDIYGDSVNLKVLRNNIYYVSTGIQMDAGLIQDNYIHDMGYIDGDHINGTTSNGGSTLLTIKHNTSFNQFSQTDAISLFEDFGVQANRVIDNNLVAGGGYCIYGGQNTGGAAAYNISITNNHFSKLYFSGCGSYGPIAAWPINGAGGIWNGNIWDDTGAAVNP